ncbi:acyltransferase domain-containing protein [Paenibacillus alba]|uniref:Acyltransferase domain-containing protein n=1 Tax=Paenibacillus alba TaxID=1197127 RepID=A0ABU6FZE1_9BACL|nr:acyltransferase domain-containing protein [Paenibacillus alba]MEC0227100.1 acyltransferase domain-containing protein [Paenibacillus alba]
MMKNEVNPILQLPDAIWEAYDLAVDKINNNEQLREHATLCHHRLLQLLEGDSNSDELIPLLSSVESEMGEQAGMFAAVMIFAIIPFVQKQYRAIGIPFSILVDTFTDLHVWMNDYYGKHGRWGLSQIGWILHHVQCRLFKIGRLQYIHKPRWEMKVWVYLQHGTGHLQIVANVKEPTSHEIVGNPISSRGEVMPQMIQLDPKEWKLVLFEDTPVLEVHIQEGGKLSSELCKESMHEAVRFFKTYFPDKTFAAFVCSSWLLGPSLRQVLSSESNIVQFQKLFTLVHADVDKDEIFQRVFGEKPVDLHSAPRASSLQRAVLDYAISGKDFDQGVGFLYLDETKPSF